MSPGAWGPGSEVRCARCGAHGLADVVKVAEGYACPGCLTLAEQAASGLAGTDPGPVEVRPSE